MTATTIPGSHQGQPTSTRSLRAMVVAAVLVALLLAAFAVGRVTAGSATARLTTKASTVTTQLPTYDSYEQGDRCRAGVPC